MRHPRARKQHREGVADRGLLLRALLALVLAGLLIGLVLVAIGFFYEPNTQIPTGFVGEHVTVNGLPVRSTSVA
jgi:hypothetical protein